MRFENVTVGNMENAIRGMRNPMMSHEKSDTTDGAYWHFGARMDTHGSWIPRLGTKDYELSLRLVKAGEPHRKFLRQIFVSVDLCKVPAYLMHEFATYKVGTTLDCSSTMHKIMSRELTVDDFESPETMEERMWLGDSIEMLNVTRNRYLRFKEEGWPDKAEQEFRAMKRMLPHSYLYEVMTWTANYEVLANIWKWRHTHRLPAWHEFCDGFVERLPYSEWITGKGTGGADDGDKA